MLRRIDAPAVNCGEELCDAVRAKDVARVKSLLDAGCDSNIPDARWVATMLLAQKGGAFRR
jgi:hypothetical protein